ncbi:MAG: phosphoribosylformylglycinamidine synthase subunit PurQ, partial [Clostridia bacterium]|nr:phosphoribosylformylglycinamidine synthase subunit PurQ [Clostridia bacterium]
LENLEAVKVAVVTDLNRLRMSWRGKNIVDLSRDFINTNGVKQHITVEAAGADMALSPIEKLPDEIEASRSDLKEAWKKNMQRLNVASQKGLVERFDSSIGGATVLMPFGGKYQLTPAEGMAAKLPIESGETSTGTLMTFGYNPEISKWSPFHGAVYAVLESITRLVAMGGDYHKARLTLQEYFEKPGKDPVKWGKPFSALLGAFYTQLKLKVAAIGGKDSMSGTFKDIQVPPTLVSFALVPTDVTRVISPEFKKAGSKLVLVTLPKDELLLPDFDQLDKTFSAISGLIGQGKILSAGSLKAGGLSEAVAKMAFGNAMGVKLKDMSYERLFKLDYGAILIEMDGDLDESQLLAGLSYEVIGQTTAESVIEVNGVSVSLEELSQAWQGTLEKIFPTKTDGSTEKVRKASYTLGSTLKKPAAIARPRVFIPVFPGTNCEYDVKRKFEEAGAVAEVMVLRNLTSREIDDSIHEMQKRIEESQIIMLPGGFSAGDEPEGSGKFIATVFRNPYLTEAVMELLKHRDGLMLGICNGFQALVKLGLLPYGEIRPLDDTCPTLTFNTIGRHVSCLSHTRVASNLSPWLAKTEVGHISTVAISHGEGRFVASEEMLKELELFGQIATQYVTLEGEP